MINKAGSITISEWETGIGKSSAKGFADMRNCDPFRKPGYLELALELVNEADTPFSLTFTANASSDLCTVTGGVITRAGGQFDGRYKAVTFTTTTTLPAGLSSGTIYFITQNGSLTSTAFNVSATLTDAIAGTFVYITDTGTGIHTVTTVDMSRPMYFRNDPNRNTFSGTAIDMYMQDSNARVWFRYSTSAQFWVLLKGNTVTGAGADTGGSSVNSGEGLAMWKNFLFAFRSTSIDVYNLATPGWTNSWKSTGSVDVGDHVPFVSKDNKLYFYADKVTGVKAYVGSIKQETTFDPATSSTYTYNATALDVPHDITALSDFNDKIMVGTISNKIYLWDGTSTSFDDPVTLLEERTYALKDLNNVLYISAGEKSNIYKTYGTTVENFVDPSDELFQGIQYSVRAIGLALESNDLLFVTSGGNADVCGIFASDLKTGAYHLLYEFSQGFILSGIAQNAFFTLSSATANSTIFAGYSYGGVTFIDTNSFFGFSSTSTRYRSYVISPLYEVGTFENPRTFQKMQLILAKPLSAGLGVRVSSRTNLTNAFSNSVTFDSSTIGTTVTAAESVINVETTQFIQFKIELQQSASAPVYTSSVYSTPTIKSLIVY